MSGTPIPQLRIPISDDMRQFLKQEALNRRISIAQMTRDALQLYLSRDGIEVNVSEGVESWGDAERTKSADDK